MPSQKRLRDELQFVTECTALFDVMQQVAVSQLRRVETEQARQLSLTEILAREYFPLLPATAHEDALVRGGTRGRLLLVMTSDEGLVGPLHASIIRSALAKSEAVTHWVLIGQRGARLLGERAADADVIPFPSEETTEEQMQRLSATVLSYYQQHQLRDVWLIAATFLSMTRQDTVVRQVLPLPIETTQTPAPETTLVLEPSCERIVQELASWWVSTVCYEALASSRRAEFAARAMHVEASRQELTKRAKIVRYEWFKALHERMDVMVRESCVVQRHGVKRRTARREALAERMT